MMVKARIVFRSYPTCLSKLVSISFRLEQEFVDEILHGFAWCKEWLSLFVLGILTPLQEPLYITHLPCILDSFGQNLCQTAIQEWIDY